MKLDYHHHSTGSDGHGLANEDYLDRAHEVAREAGYKTALVFKNRKPQEVKI